MRGRFVSWLMAVTGTLAVASCVPAGQTDDDAPHERRATAAPVQVPDAVRSFRSTTALPAPAQPVRLVVPALRIDSRLERLSVDRNRVVEVPVHWQRAGWYRDGPSPGEPGAAVILGHVDSPSGAAVFAGLSTLRRGARIDVHRADGSKVTFHVTKVEQHDRSRFPAEEVYWPTLERELRLITCAGRYDRSAGGYQSNVIAFATAGPGAPRH